MVEAQSPRELPLEIIFYNILPRLLVKSVPRFMLVSKEWHLFLKTPLFEKLHLHHVTNDHHLNNLRFLIFSRETLHRFNASHCEALDQDGLNLSRSFPFEADTLNMKILASFGGLVCVGITKRSYLSNNYSYLILWNPLTGDYKTLSKTNSHKNCYKQFYQRACGLYYTYCDNDFKLLCVTHNLNAYIYSLKSDAWRRVVDSTEGLKGIAAYQKPDCCLWPSIAFNEKLYFLKHRQNSTRGSIISFDTKTEKFTEISTPCFHLFTEIATHSLGNDQYHVFLSLTVLRGCIHFFVIYSTNSDHEFYYTNSWQHVECWLMDENGNWIKEVTLPKASYIIIEPLKVVSKGKWIVGSSCDGRAWKLDLIKHVIKDISWSLRRHMHIPRGGKYIETLVSPTRYVIDKVRQVGNPLN